MVSKCRPIKWTTRRNVQILRQVHSLPRLNQEELENMNKLIASIEINNLKVPNNQKSRISWHHRSTPPNV